MKKKGQLTNNDSALKNSEVCDFSGKSCCFINPEGLNVYRKSDRENHATPDGVGHVPALSLYKHSMPPASANRQLKQTAIKIQATSCEQRAESHADFNSIAVDFSQRTEAPAYHNGLQPHFPMWLKPREKWKPATRQLKQTAIKTEACNCLQPVTYAFGGF
jgi:hypothetical protein